MIESIVEIGKYVEKRGIYSHPFVQVPYNKKQGENAKVIVLNLKKLQGNKLDFVKLEQEHYKIENIPLYCYREKGRRGSAKSFTFKLPPSKGMLKERLKVIEVFGYTLSCPLEEIENKILNFVKTLKDKGEIAKNTPLLLSIKIDGKWPAKIPGYLESFEKVSWESFRTQHAQNGKCHICGREGELYDKFYNYSNKLKFFNLDKHGFISGVLKPLAWKQFSLCRNCLKYLALGITYITDPQGLSFDFYGHKFWLIPHTLKDVTNTLDVLKTIHTWTPEKNYEREEWILIQAGNQGNNVLFNFIFYREQNDFKILLHLENIIPSLISNFVRTKRKVEENWQDTLCLQDKINFKFFSSSNLRKTKADPGFTDDDFFKTVQAVFYQKSLDEKRLLSLIMDRVQSDFFASNERHIPYYTILEALVSLDLLRQWGVIKRNVNGGDKVKLHYNELFESHPTFFDHPSKKLLVLLGVLLQRFLYFQKKERGSTPFVKKLKGLKLQQKDIQNLFKEVNTKMQEYDISHYWKELKEDIATLFLYSGDSWPLNVDEIGFYLSVGMALAFNDIFKREEKEE